MNCRVCLIGIPEDAGFIHKAVCFTMDPYVYCSKKCYETIYPVRVMLKTVTGNNHLSVPENVNQLITWLQSKLKGLPEEFRDSMEFTTEVDEFDSLRRYFSYTRPLTPKEEREMAEEKRIREHARQQSQLAQLKRLQKLYPNQI